MAAKKEELTKQEAAEAARKEEISAFAKASESVKKAKADSKGKVKVTVLKGHGEKFGSDKIKDGSKLTLPQGTATALLKAGFVKLG